MIAKLPKPATILEDSNDSKTNFSVEDSSEEVVDERLTTNNKSDKVLSKKSPKKTKKSNSKVYNIYIHTLYFNLSIYLCKQWKILILFV